MSFESEIDNEIERSDEASLFSVREEEGSYGRLKKLRSNKITCLSCVNMLTVYRYILEKEPKKISEPYRCTLE